MPYDPNFIPGETVPLPTPNAVVLRRAFGRDWINHSRHSLLFSEERGFAFVSAHNLDGATLPDSQYTQRSFRFDPKIKPNILQVDKNRGYRESRDGNFGPNPWDQGHLARRKSLSWGREDDASKAERESDFWSNIVPQHENLHDSAWGPVEDWILKRVEGGRQQACVFTGPVFTEDDPVHRNAEGEDAIRIPAGFWKVISVKLAGRMRSAGFLIWQRDYDTAEPVTFSPALEQVRLTTIEVLTRLTFPALRGFDPLLFDSEDDTHLPTVSTSRAMLHDHLLADTGAQGLGPLSELNQEIAVRATLSGTSVITNPRDIVL